MRDERRRRGKAPESPAVLLGLGVSLALHLLLAVALLRLPALGIDAPLVEFMLLETAPADADASPGEGARAGANLRPAELESGGHHSAQNIDALSRGEHGDGRGPQAVVLLMPRDQGITLQDAPLTTLGPAQLQRIRTARDRATLEDRRATPNPNDQTFLASGHGEHAERRTPSPRDPLPGARRAPAPSTIAEGPATHAAALLSPSSAGGEQARAGQDRQERLEAGAIASPGAGIRGGRGERAAEAARVALGRPPVDPGPAATPAQRRDARVRDDEDAELLAASMIQSWVDSSDRSGPERGEGRGGVGGGGAPGSGGGEQAGGRARSFGHGAGAYFTNDQRYQRWLLRLRRRVSDALDFPRARQLAMDQGVVVYRVTLRRDGSLIGGPHLIRGSRFPDLDAAARAAIVRSSPFEPIPSELAPESERLVLTLPIEFANPMIH